MYGDISKIGEKERVRKTFWILSEKKTERGEVKIIKCNATVAISEVKNEINVQERCKTFGIQVIKLKENKIHENKIKRSDILLDECLSTLHRDWDWLWRVLRDDSEMRKVGPVDDLKGWRYSSKESISVNSSILSRYSMIDSN